MKTQRSLFQSFARKRTLSREPKRSPFDVNMSSTLALLTDAKERVFKESTVTPTRVLFWFLLFQILRRYDQRYQELLHPQNVRQYAERRTQHAVPSVNYFPVLRLHFTHRYVRRTHGPEDRWTYGEYQHKARSETVYDRGMRSYVVCTLRHRYTLSCAVVNACTSRVSQVSAKPLPLNLVQESYEASRKHDILRRAVAIRMLLPCIYKQHYTESINALFDANNYRISSYNYKYKIWSIQRPIKGHVTQATPRKSTTQLIRAQNLKFTGFRDLKSDQNLKIGHDVTDDINFIVIHPPSVDQQFSW